MDQPLIPRVWCRGDAQRRTEQVVDVNVFRGGDTHSSVEIRAMGDEYAVHGGERGIVTMISGKESGFSGPMPVNRGLRGDLRAFFR